MFSDDIEWYYNVVKPHARTVDVWSTTYVQVFLDMLFCILIYGTTLFMLYIPQE
jgi:hypothetical protein